jgi:hypothetical protein
MRKTQTFETDRRGKLPHREEETMERQRHIPVWWSYKPGNTKNYWYLGDNKFLLVQATKFVVICYRNFFIKVL